MGVDDYLFLYALGARRAYAVHRQRLYHGSADVSGHAAQRAECHNDEGQRHVVHPVPKPCHTGERASRSFLSGNGEPLQHDGKQEYEQNCRDERRHAVTDDAAHLHGGIPLGAFAHGAENAQRNGYAQRQNGCQNVDEQRVFHGFAQHVHYGTLHAGVAYAEVALQHTLKFAVEFGYSQPVGPPPDDVYLVAVFVNVAQLQAIALIKPFQPFGIVFEGFLLGVGKGSCPVEGNKIVYAIHQKGQYNKYHQDVKQSFYYISSHSFSLNACTLLQQKRHCHNVFFVAVRDKNLSLTHQIFSYFQP